MNIKGINLTGRHKNNLKWFWPTQSFNEIRHVLQSKSALDGTNHWHRYYYINNFDTHTEALPKYLGVEYERERAYLNHFYWDHSQANRCMERRVAKDNIKQTLWRNVRSNSDMNISHSDQHCIKYRLRSAVLNAHSNEEAHSGPPKSISMTLAYVCWTTPHLKSPQYLGLQGYITLGIKQF